AGVHTNDTAAVTTSNPVRQSPTTNATWTRGDLVIADAGVEQRVREIDGEIDGDDARGDEQRDALHDGEVARGDGPEGQTPETGQREHRLQHDAAGQQLAELQAGHRDDRNQRVPERVLDDDEPL